jgi:hypothetical protein
MAINSLLPQRSIDGVALTEGTFQIPLLDQMLESVEKSASTVQGLGTGCDIELVVD